MRQTGSNPIPVGLDQARVKRVLVAVADLAPFDCSLPVATRAIAQRVYQQKGITPQRIGSIGRILNYLDRVGMVNKAPLCPTPPGWSITLSGERLADELRKELSSNAYRANC